MSAGVHRDGPHWIASCVPCDWEYYTPRLPTADKAAHLHNKSNHKENN